MNLQEFKAWFEGFTEDMTGPPSKKQWERIKARVKEIDGVAVTHHHWNGYYWPYVRPYYPPSSPVYPWYSVGGGVGLASSLLQCQNIKDDGHVVQNVVQNYADLGKTDPFNATVAMNCLGKAEYQEVR